MEREKLSKRAANIFVNYRRDDSAGHAGRLFDRLEGRFPGRVFMDVDTIEPGIDFKDVIDQAVGCCEVLIVVIGREWLHLKDATGQRRLDNPNDFVRMEIGTALDRHIRVIPVLVEGAAMPRPEELPPDLVKLTRRNAIELSDARWSFDVDRLIQTIEGVLQEKAPSALLPATTAPIQPAPAPVPAPAPEKTRTLAWLIPTLLVLLALVGWGGWKLGNRPAPQGAEQENAQKTDEKPEQETEEIASMESTAVPIAVTPPPSPPPVVVEPKPEPERVVPREEKPAPEPDPEPEPRTPKAASDPQREYGPDACKDGFLWREARSGDHVCVTPETYRQVQKDNRRASQRRDSADPDKCLSGYVPREAFEGDHTCVPPESRDQARLDNSLAGDRKLNFAMRKYRQAQAMRKKDKGKE
jgi:hypothetical protein